MTKHSGAISFLVRDYDEALYGNGWGLNAPKQS